MWLWTESKLICLLHLDETCCDIWYRCCAHRSSSSRCLDWIFKVNYTENLNWWLAKSTWRYWNQIELPKRKSVFVFLCFRLKITREMCGKLEYLVHNLSYEYFPSLILYRYGNRMPVRRWNKKTYRNTNEIPLVFSDDSFIFVPVRSDWKNWFDTIDESM